MSPSLFVVVGESGEYEQRYETVCGVYPTIDDAKKSIADAVQISAELSRQWYAWTARKAAAIATFTPTRTIESVAFPSGRAHFYSEADEAQALVMAGPEPERAFHFHTVNIFEIPLGTFNAGGWPCVIETAYDA